MLELATAPSYSEAEVEEAPRPRRFDPFRDLSAEEREREIRAYDDHLRQRDGEIDWESWTLPKREQRMRELRADPIVWKGKIDRDGFYQHFHRVGKPETDIRTHWAILTAIANESERYGVELELRELKSQGRSADPIKVRHVLQEDHHTALLIEACRTLGLDGVRLLAPRRIHRWLIQPMAYLPDSMRYVLIIIGEAIGSVVFDVLGRTADLFADDPEVEARLRSIMEEIVDDERLHAVHCRTRLGKWGLAFANAVIPLAARAAVFAYPQIARLGLDHRTLTREIRRGIGIPADVGWVTGASMAAEPSA